MKQKLRTALCSYFLLTALLSSAQPLIHLDAAELPVVRIAHGAFSEKIAIMWVGAEQGIFRKHGVHVEVINIRSGPQAMTALASGLSSARLPEVSTLRSSPASSTKPTAISSLQRKSALRKT